MLLNQSVLVCNDMTYTWQPGKSESRKWVMAYCNAHALPMSEKIYNKNMNDDWWCPNWIWHYLSQKYEAVKPYWLGGIMYLFCSWKYDIYMHVSNSCLQSYVYRTVHHLDSWIKRDQLDVPCFLFHYLMLNVFRMLIHPSSGACDLFVELFRGLYCSGMMCVGVALWFGWGGMVSGCRLKQFQPA